MTQNEMIRKHLEEGRSLTPIDALNLYGCFRLATRIFELKKSGMDIETEMVENKSTGKRYARYFLRKEKPAAAPVPEVEIAGRPAQFDELF